MRVPRIKESGEGFYHSMSRVVDRRMVPPHHVRARLWLTDRPSQHRCHRRGVPAYCQVAPIYPPSVQLPTEMRHLLPNPSFAVGFLDTIPAKFTERARLYHNRPVPILPYNF
jgi:hypothetical protein